MKVAAAARAARVRQIRAAGRGLSWLRRLPLADRLAIAIDYEAARRVGAALVGYQRPFATLAEAEAAVAPYAEAGHENSSNADDHLRMADRPRPSDYPALYHLRPLAPTLRRIFDLGGNIGNLYYCYAPLLDFPPDLEWRVFDLPQHLKRGEDLARARKVTPLRFSASFEDANGADLLLASGSLHYFSTPLYAMVSELNERPKNVLINRTPLTDCSPFAGIQDAGSYRVACMLYNRRDIITGFKALGYNLVDAWDAAELSFAIPGFPACRISAYAGAFFERTN